MQSPRILICTSRGNHVILHLRELPDGGLWSQPVTGAERMGFCPLHRTDLARVASNYNDNSEERTA